MSLTVEWIESADKLSAEDLVRWNQLARNPLQRWEWLGSWWEAYQTQYTLCVLSVQRNGDIVAFVPWCVENRVGTGRTVQFLGSGKACTDHMSLLVRPEDMQEVCAAVAAFLISDPAGGHQESGAIPRWDSIELIGVDQSDEPINCLIESMRQVGLEVEQSEGMGCYVIDLPADWESYVQMRSKSGRREIRQALKNIESGLIKVHRVCDESQLESLWDHFVMLHQRRRHASGTTGCFDHPPFDIFLRKAASRLLESGLLQMVVATSDGIPVAAQFAIADQNAWYFYQSGMEPDSTELRPGLSTFCYAIRTSILTGRQQFDMMRGDEPYKLRWRAKLIAAQEVRVCSPRPVAQLRNQVYKAGLSFKNLVKTGLGIGHQHQ